MHNGVKIMFTSILLMEQWWKVQKEMIVTQKMMKIYNPRKKGKIALMLFYLQSKASKRTIINLIFAGSCIRSSCNFG